jgi:hypothetical protein
MHQQIFQVVFNGIDCELEVLVLRICQYVI